MPRRRVRNPMPGSARNGRCPASQALPTAWVSRRRLLLRDAAEFLGQDPFEVTIAVLRLAHGLLARIRCHTHDRISANAGAGLTRVGLRTGVTIVAGGDVGLRGVRANALGRVEGVDVLDMIGLGAVDVESL